MNVRNKVDFLSLACIVFMFLGEAKRLPKSGAHKRCLLNVVSGNTQRLGWKDLPGTNTQANLEHS
jgi:hypothetical protein